MVNGNTGATSSTSADASPGLCSPAGDDEEPLLYVNARQYKRILKRRAARAKLHEQGKIPKERPVTAPALFLYWPLSAKRSTGHRSKRSRHDLG